MKKIGIIVIGIIIVIGVLYVGAKAARHVMRQNTTMVQPTAVMSASPTAVMSPTTMSTNGIYEMKTASTVGQYMTDPKGMTLYTFDKDTAGVSNCSGQCSVLWPPYVATNAPSSLPTDITTIKRADGSMQYAWKGMPLYYYEKDKNPGDTTGNGVGGVWHVAK